MYFSDAAAAIPKRGPHLRLRNWHDFRSTTLTKSNSVEKKEKTAKKGETKSGKQSLLEHPPRHAGFSFLNFERAGTLVEEKEKAKQGETWGETRAHSAGGLRTQSAGATRAPFKLGGPINAIPPLATAGSKAVEKGWWPTESLLRALRQRVSTNQQAYGCRGPRQDCITPDVLEKELEFLLKLEARLEQRSGQHTGVRTSSMKAGTVTRARTPSTARSHTGHEPRGAPSAYTADTRHFIKAAVDTRTRWNTSAPGITGLAEVDR